MSPTQPSNTSVTALYLSNWQDLVGIWKARKLTQLDTSQVGPRLGELHYLRGSLERRTVNQIVDYSGFFRDESAGVRYTKTENFSTEAWFESGLNDAGTLTTNYLTYDGADISSRLRISRSFAGPPSRPFFVVRYSLTNPGAASITFNVLDQVHLHNLDLSKNVHAWYDAANTALIADMTASGQLFVVLGALQPVDGYQAGNDADSSPTSPTAGGWYSFDASGALMNNGELSAGDVNLAFNKRLTVGPAETRNIYFYIGVCETQADAGAAVADARSLSGEEWFSETSVAYNAWLVHGNQGRRVHFEDEGINLTFDRSLILMKNTQNPVAGAFSAATNPFAYGYKNWVRDAALTSIALDASGHFAEAEKYWRWMADRQGNDGTWKTTYNTWDGTYVPFVEPEFDSIGAFIYGVYRHYTLTADTHFLGDMWPGVKKSADWIVSNIQPNGFGRADYSIWEEGNALEHNSYTQAWYVTGLYATQCMAEVLGDTSLAEWYAGGAGSILTALQRPSNWFPPGSWNPSGYYNRAVNIDNSAQPLVDSSSDMLIALGVIDHESSRASAHIAKILNTLTKQTHGLARYTGDMFYFTGDWSPGGNEALGPEPSWPQMSLWVAVYQILSGQAAAALSRLQWYVRVCGKGYMAPGEAISNVTLQPLVSSMSEPLTASSFILAALMHEGQYSLSVVPPVYNAGTAKSIPINFGAADNGGQWSNVPYFVGQQSTPDSLAMYQIKRVYIANDHQNIYLRIDNKAGTFSLYQAERLFALHIYSQDFSNIAQGSNLGVFGQPLKRPMSYMLERYSNSEPYNRRRVSGELWVGDGTVEGAIAPQWDPARGRIEAVIPIAALSSGKPVPGNAWANMLIVLAGCDSNLNWSDRSSLLLHYRLSTPGQSWIYGNIEQ